jgi:hypothetical protein
MITKTQALKEYPELKGLQVIGQGMFSIVFKESEDTVLVVSDDPAKECLSFGWMPDSPLMPTIERVYVGWISLYRMPLYTRVTAPQKQLKPDQYKVYQELRQLKNSTIHHVMSWDNIKALESVGTECAELLIECFDGMSNYTDKCGFEISPRNIALDKNGDLILLDCFFDKQKIKRRA